jgi:hypothetical protein
MRPPRRLRANDLALIGDFAAWQQAQRIRTSILHQATTISVVEGKDAVSSGRYAPSSGSHLEVKDDSGSVPLSIPIRQFGFEAIEHAQHAGTFFGRGRRVRRSLARSKFPGE